MAISLVKQFLFLFFFFLSAHLGQSGGFWTKLTASLSPVWDHISKCKPPYHIYLLEEHRVGETLKEIHPCKEEPKVVCITWHMFFEKLTDNLKPHIFRINTMIFWSIYTLFNGYIKISTIYLTMFFSIKNLCIYLKARVTQRKGNDREIDLPLASSPLQYTQ